MPYAIVGRNAGAPLRFRGGYEAAVRADQDVDVLLRRSDLEAAKRALGKAGFVHTEVLGVDVFLDGQIRMSRIQSRGKVSGSVVGVLVQIKLTAFRRKDQVHLLDMIDVGIIDASWPARLCRNWDRGCSLCSMISTGRRRRGRRRFK